MRTISRYKNTPRIKRGGDLFYGRRPSIDRTRKSSDLYVEVRAEDTLQKVAYRVYGDAKLWWVVADFNDICNPFSELTPGDTLRVPSQARLFMEVL